MIIGLPVVEDGPWWFGDLPDISCRAGNLPYTLTSSALPPTFHLNTKKNSKVQNLGPIGKKLCVQNNTLKKEQSNIQETPWEETI